MRFALGVVLALALASPCLAGVDVVVPPPVQVTPLNSTTKPAAVSLARMAANLPAGRPWAQLSTVGDFCLGGQVVTWDVRRNQFNDPDFARIFREELSSAGFNVSGDQDNLFVDEAKASDLQLGALITDIRLKACSSTDSGAARGSAVLDIEWQVYSASEAKVVARIHTRGGAQHGFMPGLVFELLHRSFAENVRQLAASPEFRQIVLAGPAETAPAHLGEIPVRYRAATTPVRLEDAANGVVLVRIPGGFGSGILISPDGYILTNHHVAGDFGHVRIHWADGSESVGEVVRSDRARDVALIKVSEVHGAPLPIRHKPVELGESVYAIGTPLDHALQNTVTRGVVSGVRTVNGHSFIQSDTPVTHGNSGGPLLDARGAVIGLTDWGIDPTKGSSLNFFIPIDDALTVLVVKPVA